MTDAQQFEAFLLNYQNLVFSTAMRLTANQSEAEDITQEVFLRAYERFGELQHSPTVAGWLKTVARNLSLNHLSRYRARWSFFPNWGAGRVTEENRCWIFPRPTTRTRIWRRPTGGHLSSRRCRVCRPRNGCAGVAPF